MLSWFKLANDDRRKSIGSTVMLLFGVAALLRWHQTQMIFFALFAFRDFVAAWFIAIRAASHSESSALEKTVAYISSAMPLFYMSGAGVTLIENRISILLTVLGFFIVTLATIDLGKQMGVAPAKRGERCKSGLYRYARHPMYIGYAVAELGQAFLSPINLFIFPVSMSLYVIRARAENRHLS